MDPSAEISYPRAGKDYPRNYGDFLAWFSDDNACLDYLDWVRWPNGFHCPRCTSETGWHLTDGRWWCEPCRRRVSATAGTIFHRTRTPLTIWFTAAWHMTTSKNGISAKSLQRTLGFGSYQTAWSMLHRYRIAMARPGRKRLSGDVEVDETMIGGAKPGKRGRGAEGKVLVAVAVEQVQPKGFGRCRLKVLANAESETLRSFLLNHVEPGSVLLTDGFSPYVGATGTDYTHKAAIIKGSGKKAHDLLPGVHRVVALLKRWLLGTHQGSVEEDHIQAYLDEFTFRFNRRGSKARGMLFYRLLQQAAETGSVPFRALVANPRPRQDGVDKLLPPTARRTAPPSLRVEVPQRPWR